MVLVSKIHEKFEEEIKMGYKTPKFKTKMKYLEAMIDRNLNFNEHVDHITNNIKNIIT